MTRASFSGRTLFAIVLVGLGLRLINLADRTTEYDEILGLWFAATDLAAMVRGTAADTMPPLYYALLHLWSPSPPPLWWARLPSVVFSTLTLPILYVFGVRTLGRTPALIATLLMAVSPFFIYFAQFVKMYALLTLLLLLAALWLHEALTTERRAAWTGYVLTAVAALYTHNIAAINLAAINVAAIPLLAGHRDRRRGLFLLALANVVILVGYIPWLTYLPGQLEKVDRAFWIPVPGLAELVRTPVFFLFNLPVPAWMLLLLLFWTVLLAVAAGRVALTHLRAKPAFRPSKDSLFVLLLAVVPVALMFAVSQVRPIYVERGVMLAAAAGYVLLGAAIAQLRWSRERKVLLGGTIALMLAALVYYYGYTEFPRSRYREAAEFLETTAASGDVILHETKLSFFPMRYFRSGLNHHFVADAPGSPNDTLAPPTMAVFGIAPSEPSDVAESGRPVWVVLYQRSFAEAAQAGRSDPAVLRTLDQYLARQSSHTVGDLVLIPYRKRDP